MSKKINEKFLKVFLELDKLCCEKFGVSTGGVTEYITRLNNARYAPDRENTLPRLVRYRNIRNMFAHEPGTIKKNDELTREDVKWLSSFKLSVQKKRDPISKYLRKARRFARAKKIKKALLFTVIALLIIAVGVLAYFLFLK